MGCCSAGGYIARFTRLCSVDIRPLPVSLPNLEAMSGGAVALRFGDRALDSVLSSRVNQHNGLGRYEDPLDPDGTDKAVVELHRVLAPRGDRYV